MSNKGIDMYTPNVGAKFIESTQHQDMSNHECEKGYVAYMLLMIL